jgi:hypothetical protein
MRNPIIAVVVIGGLVLAGIGIKYGWDVMRRPIVDAGIETHMKNGTMDSEMRAAFIKGAVASCAKQRPPSVDEEKFNRVCVCYSEKAADLLTPEDAKAINETGRISDSLLARLQEPIKQCMQAEGLAPAQ